MKKIIAVTLCLFLCLFPFLCYASQSEHQVATGAPFYDYPTDILELLAVRGSSSNFIEGELVNTTKTIQRVSASDSNGFKAVLLNLLGDYETVVTDYEYRNNNNTYNSHSIQIERDYAWICSACVLGLVLFCVFRLIGGLLVR